VSELVGPVDTAVERPRARAAPSGVRSGVLLGIASVVATAFNYAFLLASGRTLGADDYGSLAALLGLLTVVLLPAGALQLAVSREIARQVASGDEGEASGFLRAVLRLGALATIPLAGLGLAFSIVIASLLGIPASAAVLTAVGLTAALVAPIAVGGIQGYQRFTALAAMYVLPFLLRLLVFATAVLLGYRLGGAVFATVTAAIASAAVAILLIRAPLRRGASVVLPALGPFLRYLGPVMVGLIGIAILTNVDVLVVKARFPSGDAGDYAAASAFAKVAFFLPATILSVLFPRTAARQARGEETEDILGRSLLVVGAFCASLAVFYAAAGRGLLVTTFGAEFAKGGTLTASYAVAMGLFSLANVLVGYHLSRGETRYAWIVAATAPVQVAVLVIVPTALQDVIWANIVVGTGLLAAHELFVDSSVPALRAGLVHFSKAVSGVRVRRIAAEGLLVLLGMTVFVCLLFLPLITALGSMVLGSGNDATGQIASFLWMQHDGGYHLFGTTHHTFTGAPFGWDEGNGINIQALFPYYVAYLATKIVGPIAAYNLVLLSGYVLSGASMYLLTRYLGCARLVSAWAGMVYIVFPWHLLRTPHGSLVHLEFLPLLILALVAATRRPSWPRLSLVSLATLACWLTAGYFGAMALVAVAAFALTIPLASGVRRGVVVAGGLLTSALAATLFVALLSVLSGFGRGAGLHRVASDLSVYGVRPLELVVPAAGNLVLGGRLDTFLAARQHGSNPTETSDYLGLLTILLAVVWVVVAWRGRAIYAQRLRSATAGLVAVLVAALLLAAPSPVGLFGHHIRTPSRLLWEVVPAIRVPARWVVLVMTALVPLAALGLQVVCKQVARRWRWRGFLPPAVAVVAVAMLVSFLELTVSPTKVRSRTHPLPALYAALERTPSGIVAEYPLVVTNDHIIWQTVYRRPLLNNADFGTEADYARLRVLDPATPGVARALAFMGVTAIVTHPDALAYREVAEIPDVPNADWGPGYRLVARTADGSSVWQVVARPAPALVMTHGGFGDPRAPRGGIVDFPLLSPSGVGYFEIVAKKPGVLRLTFDAEPPVGKKQVLRIADAETETPVVLRGRTRISVRVEVPRGHSLLLVKTDPAATSVKDAVEVTAPQVERSSGPPELHAQLVSPDVGF
jgi:O-antigen/teichoic acid export membrane protein